MPTKPKGVKRVKAWAVIIDDSFGEIPLQIEHADVLVDNKCPSNEPTDALAIFETRKEAEYKMRGMGNRRVIPCTISFTPTSK